jgi:LysM repeat protein
MANESYSEKIKRVRKEQKARFLKKQEENKKKSSEDDIVKVRAKKSKSSKLGSGASSSGSKNPTSKFQNTKKSDDKKTVDSSLLRALKNKGKANANEMKRAGPTKSASSVKVKSGNTLSQIAKSKGITLKALLAANPSITNPNKISVGQNIKIPASDKGSVYKGMTKTEMAKMAMKNGGMTMKKKTKYMAKGGMKKTKYMAKGGAGMKKTKMYSRGGAAKKK